MRDPGKIVAEGIAREFGRRKFLRRAADATFILLAWSVLDWHNVSTAVASHSACNITTGNACSPPCQRICPASKCSGADCTGGCSPSGCGGYSDFSHFCWCTNLECGTGGYYVCCDCCCPDLGGCVGVHDCPNNAGCCLCSKWVSVGPCFGD